MGTELGFNPRHTAIRNRTLAAHINNNRTNKLRVGRFALMMGIQLV
jgi:hypothetical protein